MKALQALESTECSRPTT